MPKHYLLILILAIGLGLAGCEGAPQLFAPEATPVPFARFSAEDVVGAFSRAGLQVDNVTRDMLMGRGAPNTFRDRYVFEIPRIAPLGGQFMIFDTPEAMGEWVAYVERLRANTDTRRDVIYVYPYANVLLQVNASLRPEEANAFRAALSDLEGGA
jgi:hypothetical protein